MEHVMSELQISDRLQIEALLKAGRKPAFIAKQLSRNRSTISREISRNTSADGIYCHDFAQKTRNKRRFDAKESILTEDNWTTVRVFIQQKWSPEQISGWLKKNPSYGFYVSDQWIYEYINQDRNNGGSLYMHLRRAGKPYKKGGNKVYRGKIKDRVDITNRPEIINKRLRIGDWEVDSVIGRMHQSSIVTIVERVSRYTAIIKVSSKEADIVAKAIIQRMISDQAPLFSITGDNGTEFTNHKNISESLGIDFYFTHPYSSWEKGTNENTNGLIRQYFPKGTDFNNISAAMLKEVEIALNSRPRKCLEYKTPTEVIKSV
jgi:IS30 family transposase